MDTRTGTEAGEHARPSTCPPFYFSPHSRKSHRGAAGRASFVAGEIGPFSRLALRLRGHDWKRRFDAARSSPRAAASKRARFGVGCMGPHGRSFMCRHAIGGRAECSQFAYPFHRRSSLRSHMGRGIARALARRRIDPGRERARLESVRKHARLIKPRQAAYALLSHPLPRCTLVGALGRGIRTPGKTSTLLNALSVTAIGARALQRAG